MKVFEAGLNCGQRGGGVAIIAAKTADDAAKALSTDSQTKAYHWLYPTELVNLTSKGKTPYVITYNVYQE